MPLDIHASNSSPLTIADPQNPQKEKSDRKERRHALRRKAGELLKHERVAACGQKAVGSLVSLHHHGERAHFGGIETCGSVWMCPVCAAKVTEGRRDELDRLLTAHRDAGGLCVMATLTIPHHKFQSCKDLKWAVSRAWGHVKTGKGWQQARDNNAWLGDVRALEVTHGGNGWHPHLHVLVFFSPDATDGQIRAFGDWLFGAWESAVKRTGFGQCSRAAFTYEPVTHDQVAAEYVGKWGVSMEITKAHTKTAKGGRSPWQILQDYDRRGWQSDARLFREYASAFKGARQLTWSRGFKRHGVVPVPGIRTRYLPDEPEKSDLEISENPAMAETQTASLSRDLFKVISWRGLTAAVLSAQESGGVPAVSILLQNKGIPVRFSEVPGLFEGTYVPLLSLRECPGEPPPDANRSKGDNSHQQKELNHERSY